MTALVTLYVIIGFVIGLWVFVTGWLLAAMGEDVQGAMDWVDWTLVTSAALGAAVLWPLVVAVVLVVRVIQR